MPLLRIHYLHCSIDRFVRVRKLPAKIQEIGERTPLPPSPSSLPLLYLLAYVQGGRSEQ